MELLAYLQKIETFIVDTLKRTKMTGYVLGLSGGIDSALVAAIVTQATPGKLFALLMPCDSHHSDQTDAILVAEKFHIPYQIIDLSDTYHVLIEQLEAKAIAAGQPLDPMSRYNTKVRLRMVTLYAFAQARKSLVLGTDNWDESYTGYFTKYGDGAVDILPIVELTKGEVYEAARHYGVPTSVLTRAPTAGLFPGQTDEGEMGVTYADLDAYLLGKTIPEPVIMRIQELHRLSAHKRDPIPRPIPYIRD